MKGFLKIIGFLNQYYLNLPAKAIELWRIKLITGTN